jgi:hypothetical protein
MVKVRTPCCPRCPDRPPLFHRYTYRCGPEADARKLERYWCAVCETTYGDPV